MKIEVGTKYDFKKDGMLFFKTKEGIKGHIVIHMENVVVNTVTGELTIPNSYHEFPTVFAEEIYINISSFFEVKIEPIDVEHIEISCKFAK